MLRCLLWQTKNQGNLICRTMRYFRYLPPPKCKKPMRSCMGFGWCSPGALGWGKRLTPYRG